MIKKLAFINSKGGCGKTTSIFHIAGELARKNNRILVIDFDKQGDTSNNLLSEEESNYDADDSFTVLDYIKGEKSFEEVVKKNYIRVGNKKPIYYGIDVLPSDKKLEVQSLVKSVLKDNDIASKFIDLNYDYILIDCPPSNRAVEKMVLEQIASHVIVPMSCDINSIRGYGALIDKIEKAREVNHSLRIIGVYLSMYFKNRKKHKEYREIMINSFSDFIDIQIPNCSAIVNSIEDKGQPICFYKKTGENPSAKDCVLELTEEILNRM